VEKLLTAGVQWLLLMAVALFFISLPMTNAGAAWRLRRWSGGILLLVLIIAVSAMEIRVHPIMAAAVVVVAMFAAYGALEFRKRLKRRKPEPFVEYLNLRSMGKRPVDVDDHPEAFGPNEGGAAEDRHESA
jgi:hypothetical protein